MSPSESSLERFRRAQVEHWAFERRRREAEALRAAELAKFEAGELDAGGLAAWEVHVAERVLGHELEALRGPIPRGWSTPTQIGHRLGVSAHRVGMVITELGLRAAVPGLARRRVCCGPDPRSGRTLW